MLETMKCGKNSYCCYLGKTASNSDTLKATVLALATLGDSTLNEGPFGLPISITKISHRSNFNHLKSVTCLISADREFSIKTGLVADLKNKNLEIVNKTTNHVDIVSAQAPNLLNIILWCRRRTFLSVNTWPISVADYQV
jgi:hypothetical protein